jgi:CAAX protease family protein
MENPLIGRRQLLLLAIVSEGGLGFLAYLGGLYFEVPLWEEGMFNARAAFLGVVVCLPMLALFVVCVLWPVGPLSSIKRFCDEIVRPLFRPCSLLELGFISVLAGIGEEMLFRGLLQPVLCNLGGKTLGVLATAVLFGLVHPITVTYAVLAALMGAYLGWIYLANENLLVIAIAHALYDFMALVYFSRK